MVHLSGTMTQNNNDNNEILLKYNALCAIKVTRENKSRPDCQSICDDYFKNICRFEDKR